MEPYSFKSTRYKAHAMEIMSAKGFQMNKVLGDGEFANDLDKRAMELAPQTSAAPIKPLSYLPPGGSAPQPYMPQNVYQAPTNISYGSSYTYETPRSASDGRGMVGLHNSVKSDIPSIAYSSGTVGTLTFDSIMNNLLNSNPNPFPPK